MQPFINWDPCNYRTGICWQGRSDHQILGVLVVSPLRSVTPVSTQAQGSSVAAPVLWDELLKDVRKAPALHRFQRLCEANPSWHATDGSWVEPSILLIVIACAFNFLYATSEFHWLGEKQDKNILQQIFLVNGWRCPQEDAEVSQCLT